MKIPKDVADTFNRNNQDRRDGVHNPESIGKLGVIKPEKREKGPPGPYFVTSKSLPFDDEARQIERLLANPIAARHYIAEQQAAKASKGIYMRSAIKEPMLNADPEATVRALMNPPRVTHVKDKLVRRVTVKPGSVKAASYCKGWSQHEWGIYSLRYRKGVVIRDHMGNESDTIFSGIGAAMAGIRNAHMEILK